MDSNQRKAKQNIVYQFPQLNRGFVTRASKYSTSSLPPKWIGDMQPTSLPKNLRGPLQQSQLIAIFTFRNRRTIFEPKHDNNLEQTTETWLPTKVKVVKFCGVCKYPFVWITFEIELQGPWLSDLIPMWTQPPKWYQPQTSAIYFHQFITREKPHTSNSQR